MPCPVCGFEAAGEARFCAQCGTALLAAAQSGRRSIERRLVSVLFADLEGFTAYAVDTDPEDVREMLTRYFELSSRIISRYGGSVEKFIGDAVMAVWGTPVAREDDAERAVKAALELVASVGELELEDGTHLRLRTGIVTGEAAVTFGARDQGMVAGDVVNTASRLQSKAQAGQVFVDDMTHAATEVAITYEDAGAHELKGKSEPVHVWRATGLSTAVQRLEPPFIGREKELRALKDAFHDSVDQRSLTVVTVAGVPGVGKTRLRVELERYIESTGGDTAIHVADADAMGNTTGALATVATQILGAGPSDSDEEIIEKIHALLGGADGNDQQRDWYALRTLQLLRPDPRRRFDRMELFSAWRTLLGAAAASRPRVLIFENVAPDSSLAAFLQTLLTAPVAVPMLVVALTRASFGEALPPSPSHRHVKLAPLSKSLATTLVTKLAPGLPTATVRHIVDSAEGIPLHSVEILRFLATKGVLKRLDTMYAVKEDVGAVELPHTLQLLAASRLDVLAADARDLAQVCAVLGLRFTASLLAMVRAQPLDILTPLLAQLVQEEVLEFHGSSDESEGLYAFTQHLLCEVAYNRLARKDRLQMHLAAAGALEGDATLRSIEAVASHRLAAYKLKSSDEELRRVAVTALMAAAANSAAAGSPEEAVRYSEQAAEIATDDATLAALNLSLGQLMMALSRLADAVARFEVTREIASRIPDRLLDTRATVELAMAYTFMGNGEAHVRTLRQAYADLPAEAPDALRALVMARLCGAELSAGRLEVSDDLSHRACELLEPLGDRAGLAFPTIQRAWGLQMRGRLAESRALFQLGIEHAGAGPLFQELVYCSWWAFAEWDNGDFEKSQEIMGRIRQLSRKLGTPMFDLTVLALAMYADFWTGNWDAVMESGRKLAAVPPAGRNPLISPYPWLARVLSARGQSAEALAALASAKGIADSVFAIRCPLAEAAVAFDGGDAAGALEIAWATMERVHNAGPVNFFSDALGIAAAAAAELGDQARLEAALEMAASESSGRRTRPLEAQMALAGARLAALRGDADAARENFRRAIELLRAGVQRYELAVADAEYALWAGDEAAEERAEALDIFAALGATVWLSRLIPVAAEPAVAAG